MGCQLQANSTSTPSLQNWALSPDAQRLFYYLMLTEAVPTQDTEHTLEALQGILVLDPSLPVYQDACSILAINKNYAAAEKLLTEGIGHYSNDSLLTQILSSVYTETNREDKAIDLLSEYIKKNKAPYEMAQELLRLYLKNGQGQKAEQYLRYLPLSASPQAPYIHARVYTETKNFTKAQQILLAQAKKNPKDADAWLELAFLEEAREKPLKAVEYYTQAQKIAPHNPEILLRIITLYLQSKQPGKATQTLQELAPNSWAFTQAALLFHEMGYSEEAEKILAEEAKKPRASEKIYLHLAVIHMESVGDLPTSLAYLEKIPQTSKYFELALETKVRLLMRAEQTAETLAAAHEGQKLFPENLVFWELEAYTLMSQKQFDKARTLLQKILKTYPEHDDILFTLGTVEDMAGRKKEAMDIMESIIASNPRYAKALNYVGYTLAEDNKDLDRAHDLIVQAMDEQPNSDYIVDSYAWVLFKLGKYDEAWDAIQYCISLGAEDPTIWEHYGDIALKRKDFSAARQGYTNALQRSPDNPEAIQSKLSQLPQ